MRLDIRLPIGALLALTGAILVISGLFSDPAIYARSLGVNINAWWSAVLMVIGGVMLWLAARSRRRAARGG